MRNQWILSGVLAGLLAMLNLSGAESFELVKDGRPAAVLVRPAQCVKEFETAQAIFNRTLKRISGTELPVADAPDDKLNNIRFELSGNAPLATQDTFEIGFQAPATMVIRASDISVQWAFNELLETAADVRWLYPGRTGLAAKHSPDLAMPAVPVKKSPSFNLLRDVYLMPAQKEEWYFGAPGIKQGHELPRLVFPAGRYKKVGWPQAIMPVHKGVKLTEPPTKNAYKFWQPCYSHPETTRIAVENILNHLRNNPQTKCIGLGINDNGGFCECAECTRIIAGSTRVSSAFGNYKNQSEVYYRWVNRVAEQVTKEFPNVYFGLLAYRETLNPPSFKLHPQVVPVLTLDLFACSDPTVKKRHMDTIRKWSECASVLGVWDYCWGYRYWIPRVYFRLHAEMLRFMYQHKVRAYFGENEFVTAIDGPKMYLVSRLLQDAGRNWHQELEDWYIRAVGPAAAPYLKAYYTKCENFYQSGEIKKTPWWKSRNAVYMTYVEDSWKNALKPNQISQMRFCLDKTLELAATDVQRARAAEILRQFEYAEAYMMLSGAELVDPDGQVKSLDNALALLNNFAVMPKRVDRFRELTEDLKHGEFGDDYQRFVINAYVSAELLLIDQLLKISPYMNKPPVRGALEKIAANQKLPELVRAVAGTFVAPEKRNNLFANPKFDLPLSKSDVIASVPCAIVPHAPESGSAALKIEPGTGTLVSLAAPAKPGKNYLATFRLLMPKVNPEATVDPKLWAVKNNQHLQWANAQPKSIAAGVWQTFSATALTCNGTDGVHLLLGLSKFEPGEVIYIDDVVITEL